MCVCVCVWTLLRRVGLGSTNTGKEVEVWIHVCVPADVVARLGAASWMTRRRPVAGRRPDSRKGKRNSMTANLAIGTAPPPPNYGSGGFWRPCSCFASKSFPLCVVSEAWVPACLPVCHFFLIAADFSRFHAHTHTQRTNDSRVMCDLFTCGTNNNNNNNNKLRYIR